MEIFDIRDLASDKYNAVTASIGNRISLICWGISLL